MLPLFLIEGCQWKWDYRLNFAGLLEYSILQKVAGNSVHTRLPSLGAHATVDFYQKLNSLFVTEFLGNGLLIRTELLKGNGSGFSLREFNFLDNLARQKRVEVSKAPFASNLASTFLLFKTEETNKRVITATWSDVIRGLYSKIRTFLDITLVLAAALVELPLLLPEHFDTDRTNWQGFVLLMKDGASARRFSLTTGGQGEGRYRECTSKDWPTWLGYAYLHEQKNYFKTALKIANVNLFAWENFRPGGISPFQHSLLVSSNERPPSLELFERPWYPIAWRPEDLGRTFTLNWVAVRTGKDSFEFKSEPLHMSGYGGCKRFGIYAHPAELRSIARSFHSPLVTSFFHSRSTDGWRLISRLNLPRFEVHFEELPTPYKAKNPSEILSSLAEFTYDPSELAGHVELPDLEVRRLGKQGLDFTYNPSEPTDRGELPDSKVRRLGKQGLKRNDPSNLADRDSLLDPEVCKW
jgi:hypothetical protein